MAYAAAAIPPSLRITYNGAVTPAASQLVRQTFEISRDDRRERRVDDGRRETLVLAVLGVDSPTTVRSQRRATLGRAPPRLAARAGRSRTSSADRRRPPPSRGRPSNCARREFERRFVEGFEDVATVVDAFAHGKPIASCDQRLGTPDEQVVDVAAILASDFDDVAKTVGGDQRDARQFEPDLSEQRVGRDRRGVSEKLHPRRRFGRISGEQFRECGNDASLRLARSRRNLQRYDAAGGVDGCNVGERAADVDPDPQRQSGMMQASWFFHFTCTFFALTAFL